MSVDGDVAAVMAFERTLTEFRKAAKALLSGPVRRLDNAGHPGVGWFGEKLGSTLDFDCDGGIGATLDALAGVRAANGNQAAYDFWWFCREKSLSQGVIELLDSGEDDSIQRVKGLIEYASSSSSSPNA